MARDGRLGRLRAAMGLGTVDGRITGDRMWNRPRRNQWSARIWRFTNRRVRASERRLWNASARDVRRWTAADVNRPV